MIKKGFTLQETLITLGIIGIVAALTIPSMVKLKPNETKTKYLKAYNSIANITDDILNDSALYWQTYSDGSDDEEDGPNTEGLPTCTGLNCLGIPIAGSIPDSVRNAIIAAPSTKYARLVASRMHLVGNIDDCPDNVCSFTTTDGISWVINPPTATQPHSVTINTDTTAKDSRKNTYSANCTNPVLFTFNITEDGDVRATDALGQAFLKNPSEIHDKTADLKEATKILKGTGSGSTGSGSTISGS